MARRGSVPLLIAWFGLVVPGCGDGENRNDGGPSGRDGASPGTDAWPADTARAPDLPFAAADLAPAVDAPAVDASIDAGPVSDTGPTVDATAIDLAACTVLPARIDSDTTLPKGCYLAQKTPVLGAAVTLVLEPGVIIFFSENTGLAIGGDQVLVAAGTVADPILLTGLQAQRGSWRGVSLDGTAKPSLLDRVTIEYAGRTASDRDAAGLKLTADSRGVRASITNTIVRESQGWGLWLPGSAVLGDFAKNTFTKNTLGPASVSAGLVAVLDAASSYAGNDRDQLVVQDRAIAKAAIWSLLDVPYYVTASLSVSADWTIAPGTTLVMAKDTAITVGGDTGALIAKGNANRPILFTGASAVRGAWGGIVFDGSNHARNELDHVTVEYAGSTLADREAAAVKMKADSRGVQVKIANTTMRQSQGFGLYAVGSALLPGFAGNTSTANQLGPVMIGSEATHQLLPTSSYAGNDADRVFVHGNAVNETVTWQKLDVPYLIDGYVHVTKAIWTLAPGVTLLMGPAAWISVSGDDAGLRAVGSTAAPIVITGLTPTPGAWESIIFDTSMNSASAFDHCTIEFGGGGQAKGDMGMIVAKSDSHGVMLSVTNSTIQLSAVYGIWRGNYAQLTLAGNTIVNNALGDIYTQP